MPNDPALTAENAGPMGDGCRCPLCSASRAIRALQDAHEAWLDHAENTSMELSYLISTVQEVLRDADRSVYEHDRNGGDWWLIRLQQALEIVAPIHGISDASAGATEPGDNQ